ncbi:hypothetical protein A3C57_00800, partial [Candidatus Nomurabacteria bacterium RIFCSPHIGHO2_02_FULL_33_12]
FAGPMMNIILAFVLITASYIGINKVNPQESLGVVILDVLPNSSAELAGIKIGDRLPTFKTTEEFQNFINDGSNSPNEILNDNFVVFPILRGDQEIDITVTRGFNSNGDKIIGVSLGTLESKILPVGYAIVAGVIDTVKMTKNTVLGFGTLFKNIFSGISVKDSLMGPIGIAGQVGVVADFGFRYLLLFTAMISISIGILNLLPLPALDGGRILVTIIESARRKSFPSSILQKINLFGFLALFALLIFITILDIIKLVK